MPIAPARRHVTAAAVDAALVAGPIYFTIMMIFMLTSDNQAVSLSSKDIFGFFVFMIPVCLVGLIIAILPCWLVGHALLGIARKGDGIPDPLMTFVAGLSISAGPALLFDLEEFAIWIGVTGVLVALFGRKRALDRAARER
ncbi:hypothetical protein [Sphingomicrobium arenosum]|uniref:hypothetical protein n=1 Tax=Sphingomicrobium arenosum TaxID=2233861 RepID=UPI00223F6BCF|nr:hypothetical protein [Sphingomicrobium arenosum]